MSKRNQRKTDRRGMAQHTDAVIKSLNDAEDRYYRAWLTRQTGKAPTLTTEKPDITP